MIGIKIQTDGGGASYPNVRSVTVTKNHKVKVSWLSGEEPRELKLDLSCEHYEITITGDPFDKKE